MQKQDIETILASQRKFFATGKTLPVSWRLEQLKKLRTSMLRHEEDLYGALKKDLGKSRMESYMCEIGLTLSELTWMEKHIRRLTREKRVSLLQLCADQLLLFYQYLSWTGMFGGGYKRISAWRGRSAL